MSSFRRRLMALRPTNPDLIPTWFKKSIVCWYDPKRQGCTNENMADNPILKDLSGNGLDMTCYNFAWTEGSGVAADGSIRFNSTGNNACSVTNSSLITSFNNDFTVIIKRKFYNSSNNIFGIASNSKASGQGAFIFEIKDSQGFRCLSKGANSHSITDNNEIPYNTLATSVLTKNSYNGVSFSSGSKSATDTLFLGCVRHPDSYRQYSESNIYCALFFNRTLTEEQIEWVKTNLID